MNNNIKTILIVLAALTAGLTAGYLLFGNNTMKPAVDTAATKGSDEGEEIWTCSMDPQVRQHEPGDCPICGMDLILLEKNASSDPLVLEMTAEAVKLANIQTTLVGKGSHAETKTIRLSGKVQADERLAAVQSAHIGGRIEKLYVTYTGEQVRKGQKLADIYSPELLSAQRELLEAIKLENVNPALVEAARNKLRYLKIPSATITEIETSKTVRETFPVYADANGVVTKRRVAIGDYLRQGEPILDLMDLSSVWVLFDAYEGDLASVKVGDQIEFTAAALPQQQFVARITFIDPLINAQTRIASLRTEVTNTRGRLKPEMLVYGSLTNNAVSQAKLSIPKSAVLWTGNRSVVYVKVPDTTIPSFQFREIELGESLGPNYEVMSGLEPGEEIVTYGSFVIDAAAQLNNQASMMNKDVRLKKDGAAAALPDYTAASPEAFQMQLAAMATNYLLLKDALVATDPAAAAAAAQKVNTSLEQVDMNLLKGDAHIYWMEQLAALEAHSSKITTLDEVEAQREQFGFLSQVMINSLKVFGAPANTFYVQFCPMAFNNEGAAWLSTEEKVLNPYFGDKMLTCGTIRDTIQGGAMSPAK